MLTQQKQASKNPHWQLKWKTPYQRNDLGRLQKSLQWWHFSHHLRHPTLRVFPSLWMEAKPALSRFTLQPMIENTPTQNSPVNFDGSLEYARTMDFQDPLKDFRQTFI